jgi:hypothetical protein
MSGVNDAWLVAGQPIRDLNSRAISDQEFEIRQYCEPHPQASFDQAVMRLYSSLKVSSFKAERHRHCGLPSPRPSREEA